MKRILFAVLFVLLLPLSIMAQDSTTVGADIEVFGADIEVFGTLVGDVAYMFAQETDAGALFANEDGTYTLELENIADDITILQIAPPGAITNFLSIVAPAWGTAIETSLNTEGAEPLQVAAELQTSEQIILMLIVDVEYDQNNEKMIYTVELAHVTPNLTGKEFDIAALSALSDTDFKLDELGSATLTVAGNQGFWDSVSGQLRSIVVREGQSDPQCDVARETLASPNELSPQARANIEQWISQNCS